MKFFMLVSLLSCMVVGQVFGGDVPPQNPGQIRTAIALSLGITGLSAATFSVLGKVVGYPKEGAAIGVLAATGLQLAMVPQIRNLGLNAFQDAFPQVAPAVAEQRVDSEFAPVKNALYATGALAGLYLIL